MAEARIPVQPTERAVEAHAAYWRARGSEVDTRTVRSRILAHKSRVDIEEPPVPNDDFDPAKPPLETIWRHGHERSWQRVSVRRYRHFVHVVCEQLVDGEVLGGTAIVPRRALPALIEALAKEAP